MPVERSPLWERLPPVVDPTPEQLEGVRRAVEVRARRRAIQRRRLRAIPGLIICLGVLWWLFSWREAPVAESSADGHASPPARAAPSSTASALTPVIASDLETPPAPLPVAPARHRHLASAEQRPTGRVSVDDPEAVLLARALKQLRRDHDPQGALSALETYQRRFPSGVLRPEAVLIRAESLVDLGRHRKLVDLLTPEVIPELPRSTELWLLRAEALFHLDRCREAIPVFNSLLSTTLSDEQATDSHLRERALYGRAVCRSRVGQLEAARQDLELEAAEFPAEAAKARQTLQTLKGP